MPAFQSVSDVLAFADLPASAAWSVYASAGADTRPLVHLSSNGLAERASGGCDALGLSLPAAPAMHVMVDLYVEHTSPLEFKDDVTRVSTLHGPEPVTLEGMSGSLSQIRFESDCDGWKPADAWVLRLQASNEDLFRHLAESGAVPSMFIGVTDGCGAFGGLSSKCVNHLDFPLSTVLCDSSRIPAWWVTDHFADSTPKKGIECGTVVSSINAGYPVEFVAVANFSSEWGTYRRWGFGGTWLFSVRPAG